MTASGGGFGLLFRKPATWCLLRTDRYTQEAKDYINEAYKSANDYRKYVFGEITHVWVKK